ncbi:MAG: hypothetical protein CMF55_04270 [Legionellales bacterium]|nr:hypothetical protein [Legionellales bacterium]
MTAINFPNSPSTGDTHSVGNVSYRWNGVSWESIGAPVDSVVNATGITTGDLLYYNSGSFLSSSNATVAKLNLGNFVMNTDQTVGAGQDNYVLTYDHSTTEIGLEAIPAASNAVTALNDATANELVTVGSTTTELDAEANLTFDGSTLAVTGDITATGTVLVTGDTASGDDAAIGYTAAEGLILTGQGSASDITIKNDADQEVLKVPTGTVNIETAGTIKTVGDIIADGDGSSGGITLSDGSVSIRTGTGSVAAIDLYCESGNAHKVTIQSPAHADYSGNVSLTLPTTSGVITSTGYQTIWIPAAAMYPTTTNGCAALAQVELTAGRPELKVLDFDPSSDENAQFSISMPKSWNLMNSYSNAAAFKFQSFYTVNGTNTGTVQFRISAVACSHDDTADVAFGGGYAPVAKAHTGTANDINASDIQGFQMGGTPADGDIVFFNIMRDVSGDTQSADVRLIGVKLFFVTDKANDT